jgi:2-polyprenyl-3-methyl-5-hydroxy-6-metoxy-1,4-benzoquinol methylase
MIIESKIYECKTRKTINNQKVYIFDEQESYSESFGKEWNAYIDVIDRVWKKDAKTTIEWMLGFPLDLLKGKNIIEIGCGTGRFTREYVKYANHVVAVDLSNAIYVNLAPYSSNLTLIKGNLNILHDYLKNFDVVICYGVVQHTKDTNQTVVDLFKYANSKGMVLFNVYMGNTKKQKIHAKYLLRRHMKMDINVFIDLLDTYTDEIYDFVNKYNKRTKKQKYKYNKEFENMLSNTVKIFNEHIDKHNIVETIEIMKNDIKHITNFMMETVPIGNYVNEHKINPFVKESDLKNLLKCDLVDGLLAYYDNPMSFNDVNNVIQQTNDTNKSNYTLINYNANKNTFLYAVNPMKHFYGIPLVGFKTFEVVDKTNISKIHKYDIVHFKDLLFPEDLDITNKMKKNSILIFSSMQFKPMLKKFIEIGIYPFYYEISQKYNKHIYKCRINRDILFTNIAITKQGPKLEYVK